MLEQLSIGSKVVPLIDDVGIADAINDVELVEKVARSDPGTMLVGENGGELIEDFELLDSGPVEQDAG